MENIIVNALVSSVLTTITNYSYTKFQEFWKNDNINVTLDDILKTPKGIECARIGLDFIKRTNGIPDENVFKVLKAILFKMWNNAAEPNKFLQYYAEIVSNLTPLELEVMITAYKVSKKNNVTRELAYSVAAWEVNIVTNSTIPNTELVSLAIEGLNRYRLLVVNGPGGFADANPDTNNLSQLGYNIIDAVYEEIKDELIFNS